MSGSIGIGILIKPELEGEVIRTIVKKAKLGKRPHGRMHMDLNGEKHTWVERFNVQGSGLMNPNKLNPKELRLHRGGK